jgi:hypothetical protein
MPKQESAGEAKIQFVHSLWYSQFRRCITLELWAIALSWNQIQSNKSQTLFEVDLSLSVVIERVISQKGQCNTFMRKRL